MNSILQGPDTLPPGKGRLLVAGAMTAVPGRQRGGANLHGAIRFGVLPDFELGARVEIFAGGVGGFAKLRVHESEDLDLAILGGGMVTTSMSSIAEAITEPSSNFSLGHLSLIGGISLAPRHQLLLTPTAYVGGRHLDGWRSARPWIGLGSAVGYRYALSPLVGDLRTFIVECSLTIAVLGPDRDELLQGAVTEIDDPTKFNPSLLPGGATMRCALGVEFGGGSGFDF